jgi:hypothetical protein
MCTQKTYSWLDCQKNLYDKLTLRADGDDLERHGATEYDLVGKDHFPNYEKFWRYHVAPATFRPHHHWWRDADACIAKLGQRSYSIFFHLVSAHDSLASVQEADSYMPRPGFARGFFIAARPKSPRLPNISDRDCV